MKKFLIKLMWLDDDQIKRKGRIFGWAYIAMGFFFIIGAAFLFFKTDQMARNVQEKTERNITALNTNPELLSLKNQDVDIAAGTLHAFGLFVRKIPLLFAGLICLFGLFSIFAGSLYFKSHKALNMIPQPL